jgi:phosphohistidine phosphatase
MLTLLILRHAKAGSDKPGLRDIDRPLAPRGREAAPRMGRFIAAHDMEPDLILCSSAQRTCETLELIRSELMTKPEVVFSEDLYLAEPEEVRATILARAGVHKRVMVIGHNPGLQQLVLELSGAGRRSDLEAIRTKFPTAGLAVLNFTATRWADATPKTGILRLFMSPRRLPVA